jgi:hypothetical protein
LNGTVVQTGNGGASGFFGLTIGNDGALASPYFNGDILACGFFAGTVSGNASTGEVKTINDTLNALTLPAPVFSVNPSISPSSGTAGSTLFTATDGTASNTTSYTRRWLLNAVSIGTGTTVTPASSGTLILEVTATGSGGSTIANSSSVTVSAAAVASGVRRGGMSLGLGLGLCFSSGGGSAASSSYPSYASALVPMPAAAGTAYNGRTGAGGTSGLGPLTTDAQITTALANATAGQEIWIANGTYSGFSFSRNIGTNPIRLRAVNALGVTFGGAGTATVINPSGGSGLAIDGCVVSMTGIGSGGSSFTQAIFNGAGSNFWFQNGQINGSNPSDGYRYGYGMGASAGSSNINYHNNIFSNLKRCGQLVDLNGGQFFLNRGEFISEDCWHTSGISNVKAYYNYRIDPRVGEGEHPDTWQFQTTTSLGPSNVTLWKTGCFCDPSQSTVRSNGVSIGRSEGILLQDENGSRPASNVGIYDSVFYGTEYAGINIYGSHTGLVVQGNTIYQMDGTDVTDHTGLKIYAGPSGTVSGNVAYTLDTADAFATMTGQITLATDTSQKRNASQRNTAVTAYLAEAAPLLTALMA